MERRLRGGGMTPNKKNVFGMGEVTADEMLDHLIKEIDKELERISQQKKSSWSDIRYARHNEQRFLLRQQRAYLNSLYKELRNAEILYDMAYEGSMDIPDADKPF